MWITLRQEKDRRKSASFPWMIAAVPPLGVIDNRAIHVNATSTRMRLLGAVWDVESRSMTDSVGMENV